MKLSSPRLCNALNSVKTINDLISYAGELGSTARLDLDDSLEASLIEQITNSIRTFCWEKLEGGTKKTFVFFSPKVESLGLFSGFVGDFIKQLSY